FRKQVIDIRHRLLSRSMLGGVSPPSGVSGHTRTGVSGIGPASTSRRVRLAQHLPPADNDADEHGDDASDDDRADNSAYNCADRVLRPPHAECLSDYDGGEGHGDD